MKSEQELIQSLLQRVQILEDERGVQTNIRRYATSIDYGLDDDWVDCFTEDGVFEVRPRLATAFKVSGRAELKAFIPHHTKAPSRWHKHITTQHIIEVNGDTASAQSYIMRVDHDDDEMPKIWCFGRYLDKLVRCADGLWRFRHRIIELEGIHPTSVAQLRAKT